jgi:hypothetical protein
MAIEETKKENVLRLVTLQLTSFAAGVWDTLGDSSLALAGPIGDTILEMMEKEMGLEITGESPTDVVNELSRLFVDEFGMAKEIAVDKDGDEKFTLKVKNCVGLPATKRMLAAGVEKPFLCPIMNVYGAALRRMGYKAHSDIARWEEGNGSIITFVKI